MYVAGIHDTTYVLCVLYNGKRERHTLGHTYVAEKGDSRLVRVSGQNKLHRQQKKKSSGKGIECDLV